MSMRSIPVMLAVLAALLSPLARGQTVMPAIPPNNRQRMSLQPSANS